MTMNEELISKSKPRYNSGQAIALVLLRVAIGWHFLYEGVAKLLNPNWSAQPFLMDSQWLLSDFFKSLAEDPQTLEIINYLNIYGLIAIGAGLILGLLTQVAMISGIVLLLSYYLSHPPLVGLTYAMPSEGSYLVINKTFIEMLAMSVLLFFPTGRVIGIDRLIFGRPKRRIVHI